MSKASPRIAVVVPNWNGADSLAACLDSLLSQSLEPLVIVVDNGSVDASRALLNGYSDVVVIKHDRNLGYAGGVNAGFRQAIADKLEYVAAFNNDAVADKDWLKHLVAELDDKPTVGIATSKLLSADGERLDSSGDYYTVWGLPYPRGRGESHIDHYDNQRSLFGASGGASLYRVDMLAQIGLFDEDFFAYYEDVDLSFRAQLAGWQVRYVPTAVAYHQIGATSGKLRGFTTYQTLKNLPQLLVKNVPRQYLWRIGWRFSLAQTLFLGRAILGGHAWAAMKGVLVWLYLFPRTLRKRHIIQGSKKVSDEYIWGLLVHDLPPNAHRLRRLRAAWWRLRGRS